MVDGDGLLQFRRGLQPGLDALLGVDAILEGQMAGTLGAEQGGGIDLELWFLPSANSRSALMNSTLSRRVSGLDWLQTNTQAGMPVP